MRPIVWTDDAVAHLDAITTYVAAFDPQAAKRLAARLIPLADSLAEFPDRGRAGPNGTRQMSIVWPYLLRYRVEEDRIVILRVRHGARREED